MRSITFIHFALLCGSRSSNAIRCSSLGSNDEELRLAERIFFDNGGILFLWKSIFLQLTRSWVGLVWNLERVKQKLWSLLQTMGIPPSPKTCWDYWIVIYWRTNLHNLAWGEKNVSALDRPVLPKSFFIEFMTGKQGEFLRTWFPWITSAEMWRKRWNLSWKTEGGSWWIFGPDREG